VTLSTKFPIGLNTLFILTFDTLKERKKIYNITKKTKDCYVMDVRMGGEQFDIQTVDLFKEENIKKWAKSFDIIPNNLPCGERSISYTNFVVAGEVVNIVKKINNEQEFPERIIRSMKTYTIIGDKK